MRSLHIVKSRLLVSVLSLAIAAITISYATAPTRVQAAPKLPPTLSFIMTARFATKNVSADTATPEQTISARVYVNGKRIRAESQLGDRDVVYLYAPPFGYKLLPTSRTGLRYRVNQAIKERGSSTFDPQTLLPLLQNPAAIRNALRKQGGKKIGTNRLNGIPTDIYTASKLNGQPVQVKAWLRQSDALPIRLELASKKLSVAASWRNYQRGQVLANTLFTVPGGYRIREASSEASGL